MSRIENQLKTLIANALSTIGLEVEKNEIIVEVPKDESLGDFSTNVALKYARLLKNNPVQIADRIVDILSASPMITSATSAGPGFVNFVLNPIVYHEYISEILFLGDSYGNSEQSGIKLNVEFVSANPTGDLHLGHARGAAIGDSIARLLTKAGYDVTREFYINDAGKQIENLGLSVYSRYLQIFGINEALPEDGYHGQDVIDIAREIMNKVGSKYATKQVLDNVSLRAKASKYFADEGKRRELAKIKRDLRKFRVVFSTYTSEVSIRKKYNLEDILLKLKDNTYAEEGAIFLRTTDYLDDKDRVLVKSDGSYTYLLPDIAYHLDKLSRGYTKLIDVLGADHHGYIPRITSSLMMFGYPQDSLHVEIIQMVRIIKDGKEFKMSKRTGDSLKMRDLIDEVGLDAVRYFFINRASSTHLDFDLDLASDKSSANPVYYAQYAHARLCRVLTRGGKYGLDISGKGLVESHEISLLKLLASYEKVVSDAASDRAPYKIANYIQKLANSIHFFYTKSRILDEGNVQLTRARLALAKAAQIVLKDSLGLVGVSAPRKM